VDTDRRFDPAHRPAEGPPAAASGSDPVRDEYERLFRESGPVVWRVVYAYTAGRRDIADEAVAEAFARALERRGAVRRPLPWIYRTALRFAAAELRNERRTGELVDVGVEDAPDLQELVGALRRLSPAQRAAVVLHHQLGLPVREAARLMDSSAGAVRVHLYRGRRALRALLGSEEDDDA
jgi:RNA polymerase sigma-70 factor, ECF subfamily